MKRKLDEEMFSRGGKKMRKEDEEEGRCGNEERWQGTDVDAPPEGLTCIALFSPSLPLLQFLLTEKYKLNKEVETSITTALGNSFGQLSLKQPLHYRFYYID